jgi:hypothetical protein
VGFELDAFLGRVSDLSTWKERLPSVRVCVLSGELGMVPLTGKVSQEMRAVRAAPDREEAVRGWAEVLSCVPLRAALDYFRDRAAVDVGDMAVNLERHRGEDAADKWAAEGGE